MKLAITGATGWLGKNFVEQFLKSEFYDNKNEIRLFASSSKQVTFNSKVFNVYKLSLPNLLEFNPTHLIHLAFIIYDETLSLEKYIQLNSDIILNITNFLEHSDVKKIIFLGSGIENFDLISYKKRKYSELKKKESDAIINVCKKKNIDFNKLIVWNCSGRHSKNFQEYFFLDFINKAQKNLPIEINSSHRVFRSFVSACNIAEIGIKLLKKNGPKFITCSTTKKIEIEEFAHRVVNLLHSTSKISRPSSDSFKEDEMYFPTNSNFHEIATELNVKILSLDEQIILTSEYLMECATSDSN